MIPATTPQTHPAVATAQRALSRAQTVLVRRLPELASELLRVPLVVTQDWRIDTAATDGRMIAFDAAFTLRLLDLASEDDPPLALLEGVLVHELLHIVCRHVERRQFRELLLWNCAADFVVNLMVNDLGLPLPEGALRATEFRSMSAEQVYDALAADPKIAEIMIKKREESELQDQILSEAEAWSLLKDSGLDPLTQAAVLDIGRRAGAVLRKRSPGRAGMSGHAELDALDAIDRPPPTWRQALADWCLQPSRDETSFSRPNRRMLAHGFVLPGFSGRTASGIVIGLDTSGSRWDPGILAKVLGQIQHVRDAMGCPCWIVEFDTVVQRCREIEPGEELDTATRLKGGGGTDFRCFFDELERIRTRTSPMAVAILITDACGAMPTEPQPRTCWLVPAALPVNVPFGMLLRYDEQ